MSTVTAGTRPVRDSATVLQVRDLDVHYRTHHGDVRAVREVGFDLARHEILGLIGESGCGKTTAAMTVLGLLPDVAQVTRGTAILNGEFDLLQLDETDLHKLRWREMAFIPQGAMNSLNPVMKVADQMDDGFRDASERRERRQRSGELFNLVGLPERVLGLYPHELSGGMKQRVCIAMALVNGPSLVIADEPTSALDVNVQRLVAQTLSDVKSGLGTSMIVIGHDMGLMAQMADRVAVMYAGTMVEIGPVDRVLREPRHPYTRLLVDSVPEVGEQKPIVVGEGMTPDLRRPPPGCVFQDRCPAAREICREPVGPTDAGKRHQVWCHRHGRIRVADLWIGERL